MYRWASNYARAKCKKGWAYTEYKLHEFSYKFIVTNGKGYNQLFYKYGVPRWSFTHYVRKILTGCGARDINQLQAYLQNGTITEHKLKGIIHQNPKPTKGRPTLLIKDKDALVVATVEIKGAHSLPTSRNTMALKLNKMLFSVSGRDEESPVNITQN